MCLTKPYASDFCSNEQYLVCTGLRKRKPECVIGVLRRVKNANMMYSLMEPEVLENETKVVKYVHSHN